MDDEYITPELGVFSNNRYIKTYSKVNKNSLILKDSDNTVNNSTIPVVNNDPLTTKKAVEFLLNGTLKYNVCRYCLNVTTELSELDQFLEVRGQGALYKVTIRDMVASFHPVKVVDDPNFPNKICEKCLDRAIAAYIFAQQCERSERALRNCFEDMYEKLEKLDPLERQKKRGRQKLKPNYNTLYTEHNKVIDYAEPIINMINTAAQTFSEEGPVKDYECLKCCQILPSVDALLNHERNHPKSMWYNCRLCGKSFPKRHLLKKHSIIHLRDRPIENSPNDFKCNHCGYVSKECNEFLRHIEKHRFKELMQHLVEKRMDNLCSVCLDKSSNMTQLNSMVCLNGGHMDMAGDRSLYNILASTLPDRKSYKYQELIIPSRPHIVTIMKRNTLAKEIRKPHFVFSQPIILSTDDIDFEDVYIFFFTSPLQETLQIELIQKSNVISDSQRIRQDLVNYDESKMSDIKFLNSDINDIIDTYNRSEISNISMITEAHTLDVNANDLKNNESDVTNLPIIHESVVDQQSGNNIEDDKAIPNFHNTADNDVDIESDDPKEKNITEDDAKEVYEKVTFTFSKPLQNYLSKKANVIKESYILNKNDIDNTINPKSCKVCWIFKNKSCEQCNMDKDILNDIKEKTTKPCNYCWLFKHVDKCEYCKQPNMLVTKPLIENLTEKVEEVCNKDIKTPKLLATADSLALDSEERNKPWKCTICFTNNNANRHTCFCCESKVNENENLKIKFGQYVTLFNESHRPVVSKEIEPAKNEEKIEIISENMIDAHTDKDIGTLQEMEVEPINNYAEVYYKPRVAEYSKLVKNPFAQELMDIEENVQDTIPTKMDELQQDIAPTYPINEVKQLNSFQFNIGSVFSEDKVRKLKRPLRKMSRASHK